MNPSIEFISAVLLLSPDPANLAAFYRDALGFPLKEEMHGETEKHYGCELGDIHFAIHPASNFGESRELSPGAQLTDAWYQHLESRPQEIKDVVFRWRNSKGS